MNHFDVIIVGGGLVGMTLALGLQTTQKARVALVEASAPLVQDTRLIALNDGSVNLLKNLKVWPALASHAAPIQKVHVSKRGQFGAVRIRAEELNRDALGYVIPAHFINETLNCLLHENPGVTLFKPGKLDTLNQSSSTVTLSIVCNDEKIILTANRVIGADGSDSTVRQLLNISCRTIEYQQSAMVMRVELKAEGQSIAYERFLEGGAIALLPLLRNSAAIIWTDQNETIHHLMTLSEDDFLKTLQHTFGFRAGLLTKVLPRSTFPLRMIEASRAQEGNVILMGNALHTVHPIAAQGFNLALYEVAVLLENWQQEQPFFEKVSRSQQWSQRLSHFLPMVFANDFFMMKIVRSIGMMGLDNCLPAKKYFMQQALHCHGRVPQLWIT